MKRIDSFKKFRKVVRKYWKRHARRESIRMSNGRKITSWWIGGENWCYYFSDSPEEWGSKAGLQYLSYERPWDEIPKFLEGCKSVLGQKITVGETTGVFLGLVFVNSGVLYAIQEDSREDISLVYLYDYEQH